LTIFIILRLSPQQARVQRLAANNDDDKQLDEHGFKSVARNVVPINHAPFHDKIFMGRRARNQRTAPSFRSSVLIISKSNRTWQKQDKYNHLSDFQNILGKQIAEQAPSSANRFTSGLSSRRDECRLSGNALSKRVGRLVNSRLFHLCPPF